jgi:phosphinothricin acetyltransferase
MPVLIRDARPEDAATIASIYNDAVENTTAIWNETTVDTANRVAWLTERQGIGYPVIVAVDDSAPGEGRVVGYASFGDWRAFDGYRHTVEHSVYVHRDARGGGIGQTLMVALIDRAQELGKHVMVAAIESGNVGSIRLHEKLGFTDAGTLREVGTKFDRWLDLTFLTLQLDHRTPSGDPIA